MALRRPEDDRLPIFGAGFEGVVAVLPENVVIDLEVVKIVAVGPETARADLVVAIRGEAGEAVIEPVVECIAWSAFDPVLLVEVLELQEVENGGIVGVPKTKFMVQGGGESVGPASHP